MGKKKRKKQQFAQPTTHVAGRSGLAQRLEQHGTGVALGVFIILAFAFFREAIFAGKIYFVPDAQTAAALTKPLREAYQNNGTIVHWLPYIFGGMPSLGSLVYTPFTYFPYLFLMLIESIIDLPPLFAHIIHYPVAALGVFLILRDRKVELIPAIFGGMAFMLTTHMVSMEIFGHGSKLMTAAYMPLALWAMDRLLRQGGWFNFGLTAGILGLQFQRAHIQIVYYTWMLLGAYLVYTAILKIRENQAAQFIPRLGLFVAVLALGLGMAAMLYLPIAEYTPHSIRGAASVITTSSSDSGVGFEYATQWSFSIGEMLTFLIPSFYGFGGQTYWGTMPFTDYPHYMGILVFLLGLFALFNRPQPFKIFLGAVIGLALLISFGKNLAPVYRFFYTVLPYFNKFRVPVMILIVVQFGFAILAGFGLQQAIELVRERAHREQAVPFAGRLLVAGVALLLLALLLSGIQSSFFSFMQDLYPDRYAPNVQRQLDQQRFDMLLSDWWVASLIIACGCALFYLAMRQRLSVTVFALAIAGITLLDIWRVDAKINHPVDNAAMENYLQPDELTRFLKSLEGSNDQSLAAYRIFPLNIPFIGLSLFNENRWAAQGIQSIGGYNPAKPRVYQDFLEAVGIENAYIQKYYRVDRRDGQPYLQQVPDSLIDADQRRAHQMLLDFLNVKYVLSPYPIPEPALQSVGQVNHRIGNQQVPLGVFRNTQVLPRAYLVGTYQIFDDPKAAVQALAAGRIDLHHSVILYEAPARQPAPDSTAVADLITYDFHKIVVKTRASQPQLLVLSDTYYPPGWHVQIDGAPAMLLQANHAFRAVAVPAGEHEVEFTYASRAFQIGLWLTILSTAIVLGALAIGIQRRKAS